MGRPLLAFESKVLGTLLDIYYFLLSRHVNYEPVDYSLCGLVQYILIKKQQI
jgi:hypothetical protein